MIYKANAHEFHQLSPNEWGDFLAGALGPLAIFWLVLGFFQQGAELKNSVRTLELQAKELANSVEQQKDLVEVSRETFEHKRRTRDLDEKRRKEGIQPNFILEFGARTSRGASLVKYRLNIVNAGDQAARLSIVILANGEPIHKSDYSSFDNGRSIELDNLFGADWIEPQRVPIQFFALYDDKDGERRQKHFILEPSEDGRRPYIQKNAPPAEEA